jgi:hypothetical protein
MKVKVTDEMAILICADYESGIPSRTVGEKYGIVKNTVTETLRKNNKDVRPGGRVPDKTSLIGKTFNNWMVLSFTYYEDEDNKQKEAE